MKSHTIPDYSPLGLPKAALPSSCECMHHEIERLRAELAAALSSRSEAEETAYFRGCDAGLEASQLERHQAELAQAKDNWRRQSQELAGLGSINAELVTACERHFARVEALSTAIARSISDCGGCDGDGRDDWDCPDCRILRAALPDWRERVVALEASAPRWTEQDIEHGKAEGEKLEGLFEKPECRICHAPAGLYFGADRFLCLDCAAATQTAPVEGRPEPRPNPATRDLCITGDYARPCIFFDTEAEARACWERLAAADAQPAPEPRPALSDDEYEALMLSIAVAWQLAKYPHATPDEVLEWNQCSIDLAARAAERFFQALPAPADVSAASLMENAELTALADELHRARTKFPRNHFLVEALCEELGEAARSERPYEPANREWLQVAAMAMRLYSEGTPTSSPGLLECLRILEPTAREIMRIEGDAEANRDNHPAASSPIPADLPAPEQPAPTCAECGAALNAGEAKTFTVCDACWAEDTAAVQEAIAEHGGEPLADVVKELRLDEPAPPALSEDELKALELALLEAYWTLDADWATIARAAEAFFAARQPAPPEPAEVERIAAFVECEIQNHTRRFLAPETLKEIAVAIRQRFGAGRERDRP